MCEISKNEQGDKAMYSNEREKEIMNLLARNTYATVEYLAKEIHISPSSIRRDLKRLELKGLITRSYGGAEINESVNRQIPFYLRSHKNTKEKGAVAAKAAALIKPGDVVFLDSSTSTYFMTAYLQNIRDITVVTNSIATMTELSESSINVYLAGGKLNRENPSCFVGTHAEDIIRSFHADYCFFSVQSITPDGVLYDCFESELTPRRLMIQNSEKAVFLCDNSKINRYSAYRLCDISCIDYIISDIDIRQYLKTDCSEIQFK